MASYFLHALIYWSLVSRVRAAVRDISARKSSGECSEQTVVSGGTYFNPDNRADLAEANLAQLFEIQYASTFKVVTTHMANESYVLTQCGQTPPSAADVEKIAPLTTGYTRKYFTVPVQKATAMSTVHLAFLDGLEVQDRVSYVSQWASGPCWQKAIGCGAIVDNDADQQATKMSSVDVVFMSCGYGGDCSNVHDQPNGVHVPVSQDAGALHSAEYIKYMATFFNKEPKANELFNAVKTHYDRAAVDSTDRPKVAWIAYSAKSSWGDEKFVISQATYKMHLARDAGAHTYTDQILESRLSGIDGVMITDAVSGVPAAGKTFTLPTEALGGIEQARTYLWAALVDVEAVIDETYAPTPASYTLDTFLSNFNLTSSSTVNPVKNDMVFRIDGTVSASNGLDWFESRIARPDWAVEGLARVLHGDNSKRRKYFRNIATGTMPEVLTSSMCTTALPVCEPELFPETITIIGDGNVPGDNVNGAGSVLPTAAILASVFLSFLTA